MGRSVTDNARVSAFLVTLHKTLREIFRVLDVLEALWVWRFQIPAGISRWDTSSLTNVRVGAYMRVNTHPFFSVSFLKATTEDA